MLTGIIFYTAYLAIALATGWFSGIITRAEIGAHPMTRDLDLEWISIPIGILLGAIWPITIPLLLTIASVLK
jgi:hypothetical protein